MSVGRREVTLRPTILLALGLALPACGSSCGGGPESPGNKLEWSILQTLEFDTRDERGDSLQFRTVDEYELLGVPREGDSRLIWVMLNPSHPPFYKQMPEGNFWLSSEQLGALLNDKPVNSTVEQALRSHLRSP
jgi:hypothetical protein